MITQYSLVSGINTLKAVYDNLHGTKAAYLAHHTNARAMNRAKGALSSYANHRDLNLKKLSMLQLQHLAKQYQQDSLHALHDYFHSNGKVTAIANNHGLSIYSLGRLTKNPCAIRVYNYVYHKHLHIGQGRHPITYNRQLKSFGGDNTAVQSPLLCKYYENVLHSLETILIRTMGDKDIHDVYPRDPSEYVGLYADLPWIIHFLLDDEGWFGPHETNTSMTLSQEDLYAGDTVLCDVSSNKCKNITRAILDWLSKYLFISHPRIGKPRIVFYRNPRFRTLHDICIMNRRIDRKYRKRCGRYKYEKRLLREKTVGLSNSYHCMIAGFFIPDTANK